MSRSVLRLHNTKEPLGELRAVAQDREWMKPRGLWYGVGEAWLEWCRSEMPSWVHGHTYEIALRPRAKVLKLRTVKAVREFHDEYAPKSRWSWPDWARLAKRYDGIEIAPYQWRLRLGWQTWYYGWDCASGCIWHPRAVAEIREVATVIGGSR